MTNCPVCSEGKVSEIAKVYASYLFPAKCSKCGALLGVRSFMVGSFVATLETLVFIAVFATNKVKPPSAAITLWLVFAGSSLGFGYFANLKVITSNEVLITRIFTAIIAAFMTVGIIFDA